MIVVPQSRNKEFRIVLDASGPSPINQLIGGIERTYVGTDSKPACGPERH